MHRRLKSLVSGNDTCVADDFACRFGSDIIEELLSAFGKRSALLGYENEGALHHISAILNGFLARSNTVYGESLNGILYGCKRSITDGIGVACHAGDNITGGGQLLAVFTLVLGTGDRLKAISCAASCFTTD